MDSIVETSSNSMAEDFSRSKLSTAGGHGRRLQKVPSWFIFFAFVFFCSVPYFYKEELKKLRCLLLRNYIMFFLELGLQRAYGCTCTFFSVFGNDIISERGQFVICIGHVGLVFWNRCLTFFQHWYLFGFFFAMLVWFFSARTVVWLSFVVSAILIFSPMRFPVLLSVSVFFKFSKN